MNNTLKIIGCRAGSPLHAAPASGYLLKTTKGNILIECGPGVVVNLENEEVEKLIGVVATHRHADHCLDLMALAYRLLFPVLLRPLPLYGPPSLRETISLYDSTFGIPSLPALKKPLSTAFDFTPVPPGKSFAIAESWTFDTLATKHPVETFALRSREFNFAYTSDGACTDELHVFCKNCGVLLSEVTYPDEEGRDLNEHGHMTAAHCADLAKFSGTSTLVATHLSDPADGERSMRTIRRLFGGDAILAYPGLEIPLVPREKELPEPL